MARHNLSRRDFLRVSGITAGSLALAACTVAPLTPTPRPTRTPIAWTPVTSDEILTAYRANEIAADRKYANRPLEVTGRISSPGFDKFSDKTRYEVILIDDTRFISDRLRCRLRVTGSNTNWVDELTAGDTVTVRGYIRGEWFVNVIDLEDCLPIAP